ncbi:MAG: gamma-glutamyltransferase family protein [Sphaerochaetaceae bacterium]|jgi:gamma-glutamyltranspeptidase/glutathione hydrolase
MSKCSMSWESRYSMPRHPVVSKRGMVATSQPTAAQAGISIMEKGGNAIDAAIATAAALTVVEPTCNGLGGDAFAIIYSNGKIKALNGSGPSPASISLEEVKKRGFDQMPLFGWESVTVPGVVASWAALAKEYGKLPLSETLKPAIKLAKEGFAVPPNLASLWQRAHSIYAPQLKGEMFDWWYKTFIPNGKIPKCLEVVKFLDHARSLELIAQTDGEDFYKGEIAQRIDDFSSKYGGFLRKEDLKRYKVQWVDPIKANYRGYEIWEVPPNTQGIATLMALNILSEYKAEDAKLNNEHFVHWMIESIKLSMVDAAHYVTDPTMMKVSTHQMLSSSWANYQRDLIREQAIDPTPYKPVAGGTVYLATADDQGNMVSYIQSNYEDFGSALVVPGTGIALQDRGANFFLDENHHNVLAPNKKTYHTIIPGFITKDSESIGPFGVMGGFNQPQGHLQVVSNLIDNQLNPQAALDAPRWRWLEGKDLLIESHYPLHIAKALSARGHNIKTSMDLEMFGRGQIIWRDLKNNTFIGGTESRTDSLIAVL